MNNHVDETGLCDQSCKYDAFIERPPDTVECHVHKRTDEYVRKEPFHSSATAAASALVKENQPSLRKKAKTEKLSLFEREYPW